MIIKWGAIKGQELKRQMMIDIAFKCLKVKVEWKAKRQKRVPEVRSVRKKKTIG